MLLLAIDYQAPVIYNGVMNPKERMNELTGELLRHQHLYYVLARPEISDAGYDRLMDELAALEKQYPEYVSPVSPCLRVGSDLDNTFPEREHSVPVLSLDKEYTAEGLSKWVKKTAVNADRPLGFVVEEKIDGASIVLYYKNGQLEAGVTRGNGMAGNDVTPNVRTIGQVPLRVPQTENFAVRGEIYIRKGDFSAYNSSLENKYSNPRNLAAGSMRNIRSSAAAAVPLNIFIYEGYFPGNPGGGHISNLALLRDAGFRINTRLGFFCDDPDRVRAVQAQIPDITAGALDEMVSYVGRRMQERDSLEYEIDGLVIKVDELDVREILGYTSHHPRWALAFKFDAPTAQTRVNSIQIQVGRHGRVTPVAILEPVKIAGSTVSRATLHNQEYIDILELGVGDLVSISKRGDIIPAVEEVIDKNPDHPTVFAYPPSCPYCLSTLVKDGAHHFCRNRECPERRKRSITHFAAKEQMDIDSLGGKTIEFLFDRGFIKDIPDLYTFNFDQLASEEGFGAKKISNLKKSIETSKNKPFSKVLTALGIDGLGSAVEDLIHHGFNDIDTLISAAAANDPSVFTSIAGFGDIMATLTIRHFTDAHNLHIIQRLRASGLNFHQEINDTPETPQAENLPFSGQTWVITGSFAHFQPRSRAAERISALGGKIADAISSKTTHLLAGEKPGSKIDKARKLNITIVNESEFMEILDRNPAPNP